MARDGSGKTCGGCAHGVPCKQVHKDARYAPMDEWLACLIRQTTPEEKAKFLSPNCPACSAHVPKPGP